MNMKYTVNSCTDASGRVVWSIKKDGFHNLLADVTDEEDARAVAAELNAIPDPLDIAYLAMGAADALREHRDRNGSDLGQPESAIIGDVIEAADILRCAWPGDDWSGGVWYYEVSEELGAWIVREWIARGTCPDDADIARQIEALISDSCGPVATE